MARKLKKIVLPGAFAALFLCLPYCMAQEGFLVARPDPEGVATELSVGIYVTDISDINSVQQSFTPNFVMVVQWKDPRLAGRSKSERYESLTLSDIWHPNLLIINQRRLHKLFNPLDHVSVNPEGIVTHAQQYFGELVLPMNLKKFPFDKHVLPITILAGGYGPQEVSLIFDKKRSGRNDSFSIADWAIGPVQAREGTYYFQPQERDLSRIDFELFAQRYSGFYVSRIIIPLILIVIMSFMVFWIDPRQLGPQLGVATTSMLTIIAFQFAINNSLPRIFYLTRIDLFILGSTILVFFALIESIITSLFVENGKQKLALSMDKWMRALFPLILILLFVYSFFLHG